MESVIIPENIMLKAKAYGLLHEISAIPKINDLYLEGWAVEYFNGPKKHSWEDFLRRLNEVEFLSCSKNVDDSFIEYVFNRLNGITVSIKVPKVWRHPIPIKINETRPKLREYFLSF